MDIELAKTFLEIVRCGSLIAAADRMHVTQTAITARVQKLEYSLNSKLFVRNRAGAKLTADGEAFVVYANQLVQTWDAAVRDLPLPEGFHKISIEGLFVAEDLHNFGADYDHFVIQFDLPIDTRAKQ